MPNNIRRDNVPGAGAMVASRRCWLLLITVLLANAGFAQDMVQPYMKAIRPHALAVTVGSAQDADIARQALSSIFLTLNVPVTYIDNSALIDAMALSSFDLVVVSGPLQLTAGQEQALMDYVQNGGGFIALHNALDGPKGGAYEKLLGARFTRRAGPYNVWLHMTDAGRRTPLLAGVMDFNVVNEEQIFMDYTIDPPAAGRGAPGGPAARGTQGAPGAQGEAGAKIVPGAPGAAAGRGGGARGGGNRAGTHVLMTGYAGDNSIDPERAALGNNGVTNPIAGWWNEVGRGRMVYISPGYTAAVMNHPKMQRLYENAVRWVLTKLD
jgi:type 1 glutamine amidotransferase